MCQRGGCSSKGVDTRWYASKDAGLKGVDLVGSHIDWREERVPARTLGLEGKGVDCEIPPHLGRRTEHPL